MSHKAVKIFAEGSYISSFSLLFAKPGLPPSPRTNSDPLHLVCSLQIAIVGYLCLQIIRFAQHFLDNTIKLPGLQCSVLLAPRV